MIVVFAVPFLDKLKIDDVVGAIPVHLFAGIWGTLVVAVHTQTTFNEGEANEYTNTVFEQLLAQGVGVVLTAVWVVAASAVVWLALKYTIGVRPSEEDEVGGLDHAEIGVEAYPEFART